MRFFTTTLLLLAALLTICLAKPIPLGNLDDIERRWFQGESEVCLANLPGCYVLAWIRSLGRGPTRVRLPVCRCHLSPHLQLLTHYRL